MITGLKRGFFWVLYLVEFVLLPGRSEWGGRDDLNLRARLRRFVFWIVCAAAVTVVFAGIFIVYKGVVMDTLAGITRATGQSVREQ
jgi:hypothetical protein